MRLLVIPCIAVTAAFAETHTLTLRQAAERAMTQSPDALLARLDEQKAALQVEVARDPFFPKLFVGSGLAYSYGFPMSIEGSAPSIFQAKAIASVYNKKQRLEIERTREEARGVKIDGDRRREEAIFRTVDLYLETERHSRLADLTREQIARARKVEELVRVRVDGGRELPVEARRASLEIAKAEQRVTVLESGRDYSESSLALVLGYAAGDRVRPAREERDTLETPANEQDAVRQATEGNKEIQRLQSALAARGLEARAERAARLPQLDLVAQYGLFARFNNYDDFFRRFQRNNGQVGVSVQVPLLPSKASTALAAQADAEAARLRVEIDQARGRIAVETQKRFRDLQTAESARKLSRLDLDIAREQLSVEMARMEEGKSTLRQVEQARIFEQEKWIAYHDAVASVERARYSLLERTGALIAALRK